MDHEEINKIRTQHTAKQWPKFLESLSIKGLRGWTGQSITFAFPLIAIVGENGTGKSTILKSAACAYDTAGADRRFYPSGFFLDTHWDSVSDATLRYTVRQGDLLSSFQLRKPSKRWSIPEKGPKRNVFWFDISRTIPLDASAGYARLAKLAAAEVASSSIEDDFRDRLSHVLGRTYISARFAKSDADAKRDVGLLKREFGEVSQYHQGAGEDSTLDLFRSLQNIPETSLLIIDEVEASLHPRAQRRLMRFLLWLARQKRIQIIVSTHSPYVLEELPPEARVLLLPGPAGVSMVYGITPEFALSRLDDAVHPELNIFVEDRQAEILVREILAGSPAGQEILPRLEILPVGPANVVQMMGQLSAENKLPYKSVAIVDADEDATGGCLKLPGAAAPERVVFGDLRAKAWPSLHERFGVGAGNLMAYLEDAMLEPDHHLWPEKVGDRILKSKTSVWETLASEWVKSCLSVADRDAFTVSVRDQLPG